MSKVGCASGAIECGCTNYKGINDHITDCLNLYCTPAEDEEFRNLAADVCEQAGKPIEYPESDELYTMELHSFSENGDKCKIVLSLLLPDADYI